MLYKVDLYNSVNGKIVNDSDKVDYIIVEKRNNKIKDVFFNNDVNTVSFDKNIEKYIFNEEEFKSIKQDRYLCGMAPCIKLSDLDKEHEINYDDKKGYNEELTKYIASLEDRFYTQFLDRRLEATQKKIEK